MRGDQFFQEIAHRPPFTKLHPRMAVFFKDYLSREKVVRIGDKFVVNTNFPPYPSPAFERFTAGFYQVGSNAERRLHSVTLALTNRCSYRCWHCYNADRSQKDIPLTRIRELAEELGALGANAITLTGGEPLLRSDLEEIIPFFDERFYLTLGTTGDGLTEARACRLRELGLFAVGISLDSAQELEHDRLRGRPGAFQIALTALRLCRKAGLYSYVVAVASKDLLAEDRFFAFLRFAGQNGAYEVHLLEPCPIGRIQGREDIRLSPADSQRILDYQAKVAQDDDLPILSAFAYVEAPEAFGCGAGLTHLYIDGSGEVSPCNFVPLSFGNIITTPLQEILDRMGRYFCRPRPSCIGQILSPHIPDGRLPTSLQISEMLCEQHLPREHEIPRFFQLRSEATSETGSRELKTAYDTIHSEYDRFWLCEAGKPIAELVDKLSWSGRESVFEAGCGTGYATALLAQQLREEGSLLAVDLSPEMLALARQRIAELHPVTSIRLIEGDALALLEPHGRFDLVFSSWVLGYIPIEPFFRAASLALQQNGKLAFLVHRDNSPKREMELFYSLGARNPEIMEMRVAFDFPTREQVEHHLRTAGLKPIELWEGAAIFHYSSPNEVLEHLLKSGAGTAYYHAVKPQHRSEAEKAFLELLQKSNAGQPDYAVIHDYLGCIASR